MTSSASAESHPVEPPQSGPAELASYLGSVPRGAATFVVGLPAPVAPLDTLLGERTDEECAMLWEPASGPAFAALGAAEVVTAGGADRVNAVRTAASALLQKIEPLGSLPDRFSPRFVGGLSFFAGSASTTPWTSFGDARFFLPRYCYLHVGEQAYFTVTLRGDDPDRPSILDTAVRLYSSISSGAKRTPTSPSRRMLKVRDEVTLATWTDLIEQALSAIRSGALDKVVASRRTRLVFEDPLDPLDVLADLASTSPNVTRFAIRFGDATFLGTTPEQLARKAGRTVFTEALAGSVEAAEEATLVGNRKERAEHEFVRLEILRRLGPLCDRITYPPVPEVRRLHHIAHLRTPFEATLAAPLHVLDLVDRLHPTPAVGGVPAEKALQWIAANEPVERGWYAAPIGWFDAHGDGDFCVALRSGVVRNSEAYLYAGGGIVQGSNPLSEYKETELKLASISGALRAT